MSVVNGRFVSHLALPAVLLLLRLDAQPPSGDLTAMSLEDLMRIEITSVSRKEQPLFSTAAAVFVLTHEDIKRSGATTLPDVLRLVPGLHIGRIDTSSWVVTSRGFTQEFNNKLLVLIDGRSIYTPLFSGVLWSLQDLALDNVERIEVIRGPGASVWGANAVTGVINIITLHSKATQGGLIQSGGGNEEQWFGTYRYGGAVGKNTTYRIFSKYFTRSDAPGETSSAWRAVRSGVRSDTDLGKGRSLMVQAEAYDGTAQSLSTTPVFRSPYQLTHPVNTDLSAGHVLSRWVLSSADRHETAIQTFADFSRQSNAQHTIEGSTFDVDLSHRFSVRERHQMNIGFAARLYTTAAGGDRVGARLAKPRRDELFGSFVQDEWTLIDSRLSLTAGAKFERNDYNGFQIQPSVRMAWTPRVHRTIWAAFSRAVRTPSRAERELDLDLAVIPVAGMLAQTRLIGNPLFAHEGLNAFEAGFRQQFGTSLSFDLASFYNVFDSLRTLELQPAEFRSQPFPHLVLPNMFANGAKGRSYGGEFVTVWNPMPSWKVTSSFTMLIVQSRVLPNHVPSEHPRSSPRYQSQIHSSWDVTRSVQFDSTFAYVGRLVNTLPYKRFDSRLMWKATPALEISMNLRNALASAYPEFANAGLFLPQRGRLGLYCGFEYKF